MFHSRLIVLKTLKARLWGSYCNMKILLFHFERGMFIVLIEIKNKRVPLYYCRSESWFRFCRISWCLRSHAMDVIHTGGHTYTRLSFVRNTTNLILKKFNILVLYISNLCIKYFFKFSKISKKSIRFRHDLTNIRDWKISFLRDDSIWMRRVLWNLNTVSTSLFLDHRSIRL